ncbi:MAG: aquaporin [Anaerolineae bacterium]|jgi:aquaporin Z|nr:aquaporin [Anaerolineae bacterium]
MSQQRTRELVAEFIGTFMLVFVGAGAARLNPANLGTLIPALAYGLMLTAAISTYGHISGGHFNPAVSLALWIGGKLDTQRFWQYVVAQVLASFAACAVLLIVLPTPGNLGQTVPAVNVNELDIFLVEGLLTFFLVSVVYQSAAYGYGGSGTPLFIGLTLAAGVIFAGPLTGGSLNPARTLGPAFLGDDMQSISEVLVYLAAIFVGGALAGFVHMDTMAAQAIEEDKPGLRRRRKSS